MASIYKRPSKRGKGHTWRVVIRVKGHPVVCKTCDRKEEAENWAAETERLIKRGQYNFETSKRQFTYADLHERLHADGVLQNKRAFKNVRSQFEHWKNRLGVYALVHITLELLSKERQHLIEQLAAKGLEPNHGTINRYEATLSSALSYAVDHLRWIPENPCRRLLKLKEHPGRDRILSEEEIGRLLASCEQSKSPYLHCIVLFAICTGARRGEILGLEWKNINFETGTAHLKETKNGRPRSVSLPPLVLKELQRLHSMRDPKKPLVFASRTAFGRLDIKKAWMEAVRRAQIQDYRFHDLRHQFATWSASMGASNLELATAMGHRTLQMLQKYTHLDERTTRKYSYQIAEKLVSGEVKNA
ncbi:MAG: site-specific integrase [Verrucomicrobia bacterium]|nr:site-specific integrase [Verrucomicrobiota bacterium]